MSRHTVLLIEDDPDIREIIKYNLEREGFRVHSESDGDRGLEAARRINPDLVVLDLMLPGVDGVELCRRLKEDPVTRGIAVIMVTAKGDETDVVLGLGVGADDYVPKPFGPKALMARVRAVLRRGTLRDSYGTQEHVRHGALTIDTVRHEAKLQDEALDLTPTEFRLLHLLASHPGRAFSRAQLLSRVIGESAYVLDRNIDVHVRSVRQKLGSHRDLIETVRGVGYRFRA
ncbi:MAG: response regulator [Planctomycetes bacterium]|nr:response regulator [Planctomycetota bacterium]